MKYFVTSLFAVMILAQWFIPLKMIFEQESVLKTGTVYKFKTQPIDPTDPFRGKYITLRFEEDTFLSDSTVQFQSGEDVFVGLKKDEEGFAVIESVSRDKPTTTSEFVQAKTGYADSGGSVQIRYPFNKFYLEESKAADAERAYWEANSDSTQIAYALVNIKDGNAALKDVIINGKSIVDLVNEMNSKTE